MTIRPMLLLAGTAALLAACNSSESVEEEVAEAPPVVVTPAPVPTAAPDGTALASGRWSVSEDARGAKAVFGEDGETQLAIVCEVASRTVMLTRADAASGPVSYAIEAGGEVARLDMAPAGDGTMAAEIEPTLAIFAAFSAPDTAIAFTSEDGAKVQYPTHPGIRRVLYACS